MQTSLAFKFCVSGESLKLPCLPSRTNACAKGVVSVASALSSMLGTILYTHLLLSCVSSSQ